MLVAVDWPNANQALAVLTAALVFVTAWYAKHTREMVREMRATRVDEAEAREEERLARRREKSERAALVCLEAIRGLVQEIDRWGAGEVDRRRFRQLHEKLSADGPLIMDDDELRDHVLACGQVAFVAAFGDEAMKNEGLDPGLAALLLRGIASSTAGALSAYLTEQERGPWHWDTTGESGQRALYPTAVAAGAWIREHARRTPPGDDEGSGA